MKDIQIRIRDIVACMFKKLLNSIYRQTAIFKRKTIKEILNNYRPFENLLDVDFFDGESTLDAVSRTNVKNIYGVEPIIVTCMFKKLLNSIYRQTAIFKRKTIKEILNNYGPFENLLDVGCWDGESTLDAVSRTNVKNIYGVEPIKESAKKAENLGIKTQSIYVDREEWEFEDNKFDCIISTEVIEHLTNVDFFIEQAIKKLKKGGYLITTTNNLASFHNIFSLLFGWAPMDLANSSIKKWTVGNPLSQHNNEDHHPRGATWSHKCVYTPYWLSRWMELYDLEFVEYRGIGYYPLPPIVGKYFKKHASIFTLVMKKK